MSATDRSLPGADARPRVGLIRPLALWAGVALLAGCTRAWDPETGEPLGEPREAGPRATDVGVEPAGIGQDTDVKLADALLEVQPADVVVMPVDNRTGLRELDQLDWRELLIDGLVERRYSPLGTEWADARREALAEAGNGGPLALVEDLEAGALLVPRLLAWDESQLEARNTIALEAELMLVDPRRGALEDVLWGYRLVRRIELPARSVRNATRDDLRRQVLERLSEQFMQRLTRRDPRGAAAQAATEVEAG